MQNINSMSNPSTSGGNREISRSELRHIRKNQKRTFKGDKVATRQVTNQTINKMKNDKASMKNSKNLTKNKVINQARGNNN